MRFGLKTNRTSILWALIALSAQAWGQTPAECIGAHLNAVLAIPGHSSNVFTSFSKELGIRHNTHDPHTVDLIELGWSKHFDSSGQLHLLEPDPFTLFSRYESRIAQWIKTGILTNRDTIRLSVLYKKVGTHVDDRQFLIITPGIDKLPSSEWEVVQHRVEVLDAQEWAKAMSQGKMVVQLSMLAHDQGHITELFENPKLMKAYRDFYRRQVDENWVINDDFRKDQLRLKAPTVLQSLTFWKRPKFTLPPARALYGRQFTLSEWLSIPNISSETQIKRIIPQFWNGGASNLQQNIKFLQKLSGVDFDKHVDQIIHAGDSVLLRHGGALRDPYNLKRLGFAEGDIWLRSRLKNWPRADVGLPDADTERGGLETLQTIKYQVEKLYQFLKNPHKLEEFCNDQIFLSRTTAKERLSMVRALLIDRLARYETALFSAIRYRVTADKVVNEMGRTQVSRSSDSYKYFESFTDKNSYLRLIFVDSAKR